MPVVNRTWQKKINNWLLFTVLFSIYIPQLNWACHRFRFGNRLYWFCNKNKNDISSKIMIENTRILIFIKQRYWLKQCNKKKSYEHERTLQIEEHKYFYNMHYITRRTYVRAHELIFQHVTLSVSNFNFKKILYHKLMWLKKHLSKYHILAL